MLVTDFAGTIAVIRHIDRSALEIRAADPRVAISDVLLKAFRSNAHATWNDPNLTVTGIDRNDEPIQVTYRRVGFDQTSHPEANEGGFHLFERVDIRQEAK